MVIETFLIFDYTISVLNYTVISELSRYGRDCSKTPLKMWAWLHVESPLLRFLEISTDQGSSHSPGLRPPPDFNPQIDWSWNARDRKFLKT